MRYKLYRIIPLFFFLFSTGYVCSDGSNEIKTVEKEVKQERKPDRVIPAGLQKLLKAYPDFIDSVDENNLYWKDGTKMVYDDGKKRSFDEMIDNASLKDMMSQEYKSGDDFENPPQVNFEPGRIRNTEFFKKMYGYSSGEVQGNLASVQWMPNSVNKSIVITAVNGVDIQLKAISDELDKLPSDLKKYVTRLGGTFLWRVIEGTNRLSMHSFGIAIDINTDYSNFWKWDGGTEGHIKYRNKIPMEIVKIFERFGFIWGGKWYHYDTMHFEYRPELIINE